MVGESEKSLRRQYERAQRSSACIIFLEEVYALASRYEGTSSALGRVVAHLIHDMDGVNGYRGVCSGNGEVITLEKIMDPIDCTARFCVWGVLTDGFT